MVKVCPAEKSNGIDIYAGFRQVNGDVVMEFEFQSISCETPVSNLAIQLNKNSFGLSPVNQQVICNPPVRIGSSGKIRLSASNQSFHVAAHCCWTAHKSTDSDCHQEYVNNT